MQINKMKECSEYTDNELNNLNYFDAIALEKRSFIQIYFSLLPYFIYILLINIL